MKCTLNFSWCTLQSYICKYTCEMCTCTMWMYRVLSLTVKMYAMRSKWLRSRGLRSKQYNAHTNTRVCTSGRIYNVCLFNDHTLCSCIYIYIYLYLCIIYLCIIYTYLYNYKCIWFSHKIRGTKKKFNSLKMSNFQSCILQMIRNAWTRPWQYWINYILTNF